ncbi:MAG TPA: hypothetical protein PLJ12_08095, partial [Planctomycetota bacterium]|nr:hypothetical protein [Planctomycetota bacterium]
MKKILLAAWLCLPVAGWAYHQGPGQERLRLDRVDAALADAAQELQDGNHDAAVQGYELALKELP